MIVHVTEIPLSTNSAHMQLKFGCLNEGHHTLVLSYLCAFVASSSMLVAVRNCSHSCSVLECLYELSRKIYFELKVMVMRGL
jgi:hypothetical protein